MEILIKILIFCKVLIQSLKFTYEHMIKIQYDNNHGILIFHFSNQHQITKFFI